MYLLIKLRFSTSRGDLGPFWLSCFGPLISLLSTLYIIWVSNLSIFSKPDDGYSRNATCALNVISTFSLPSLGQCVCWWTIKPRGYHPPSSQSFSTDTVYRYIYNRNLKFLNNVIINKTKVLLPQAHIQ
jgi:hypothetical protein